MMGPAGRGISGKAAPAAMFVLALVAGGACLALATRSPGDDVSGAGVEPSGTKPLVHEGGDEFEVPPPPFSEGAFPCSECHADLEPNPQRRELEDEHTEIVLRHDEQHRWCLDCHNPDDRDKLRLASGKLIDFTESYKLCGQCHGDKYRDWKAGVHGKRSGHWNGRKRYLLCAHCHNPHRPRFKPVKPMPPPKRPETL